MKLMLSGLPSWLKSIVKTKRKKKKKKDRDRILGGRKKSFIDCAHPLLACMFINGVDPLHVPRHHFDASLLRAVSREKLVIRLQVEHARSFPRVHRGTFVQVSRDTISLPHPSEKKKRTESRSRISFQPLQTYNPPFRLINSIRN